MSKKGGWEEWGKEQADRTGEVWESEWVWLDDWIVGGGGAGEVSGGLEEFGLSPGAVGSLGLGVSWEVASSLFVCGDCG